MFGISTNEKDEALLKFVRGKKNSSSFVKSLIYIQMYNEREISKTELLSKIFAYDTYYLIENFNLLQDIEIATTTQNSHISKAIENNVSNIDNSLNTEAFNKIEAENQNNQSIVKDTAKSTTIINNLDQETLSELGCLADGWMM